MQKREPVKVVTSFIEKNGRILIVRRSGRVGSYQGRWSGISGYLEDEPLRQAIKEIEEETGISRENLRLIKRADPLLIVDGERRWLVYPFLFKLERNIEPRLDWENVEYKWIDPGEMDQFETVPGLKDTFESLK